VYIETNAVCPKIFVACIFQGHWYELFQWYELYIDFLAVLVSQIPFN